MEIAILKPQFCINIKYAVSNTETKLLQKDVGNSEYLLHCRGHLQFNSM